MTSRIPNQIKNSLRLRFILEGIGVWIQRKGGFIYPVTVSPKFSHQYHCFPATCTGIELWQSQQSTACACNFRRQFIAWCWYQSANISASCWKHSSSMFYALNSWSLVSSYTVGGRWLQPAGDRRGVKQCQAVHFRIRSSVHELISDRSGKLSYRC